MSHIARINVQPGDRIHRVIADRYRSLSGTCARAWNRERSDGAVPSPQEAVIDIASVDIRPRDWARGVDNVGRRAFAGTRTGAWNIVSGNGTSFTTREAMI